MFRKPEKELGLDTSINSREKLTLGGLLTLFISICVFIGWQNFSYSSGLHEISEWVEPSADYQLQPMKGYDLKLVRPTQPDTDISIAMTIDPIASPDVTLWLLSKSAGGLSIQIGDRSYPVNQSGEGASQQFTISPVIDLKLTQPIEVTIAGKGSPDLGLGMIVVAPYGLNSDNISHLVVFGDPTRGSDIVTFLLVLAFGLYSLSLLHRVCFAQQISAATYHGTQSVVLAAILFTAANYQFGPSPSPSPLSPPEFERRVGLELILDDTFYAAQSVIQYSLKQVLPDRTVVDEVPEEFRQSDGELTATLFRTGESLDYDTVFPNIWGGYLKDVQLASWHEFKNLCYTLLAVITLFWLAHLYRPILALRVAILASISLLSIILSLRVSYGFDEFYINLRHAWMLLEHGIYSINPDEISEASVDLVPLLLTALLGLLGTPLTSAWIGCYPNVIWVGGTGFTAATFTGCLLGAAYFLLFTERRAIGLVFLACLTLVRTEGILLAALLMAYTHVFAAWPASRDAWPRFVRKALTEGALVASPFILLTTARYLAYGSLVPTPMTFKNSGFDVSYALQGVYRFYDMGSQHDLHLLLLFIAIMAGILLWGFKRGRERVNAVKNSFALTVIALLFTFPYFLGGADWFPSAWNRYGQMTTITSTLVFLSLLYCVFHTLPGNQGKKEANVVLAVFMVAFLLMADSALNFRPKNIFTVTGDFYERPYPDFWERVDRLSELGHFFKEIIPARAPGLHSSVPGH